MSADELLMKLPSDLRAKAESLAIYGHDANQMLLITRDDDAYALTGFNSDPSASASLAYCFTPSMSTSLNAANCFATRIETLSGKGICEIANSPNAANNRYVLLRTKSGELYSFGDVGDESISSPCGTLPSASKRRSCYFTHQTCTLLSAHPLLQDKRVVQITCGSNHAACLTSYGEVFAWSIVPTYHERRCMSPKLTRQENTQLNPSMSKLNLHGCIVRRRSPFVEIASYQDTVVGLDEDGHVFEWQFCEHSLNASYNKVIELTNDDGMLNSSCRMLASESIKDVRIVHIAAGKSHCLAVSNSFAVYSWGSNDCGQLGLGLPSAPCQNSMQSSVSNPQNDQTPVSSVPTRIPFFDEQPGGPLKKIKSVSAHSHLDISMAEAVTGDIYVWGDLSVCGFSACTSRPTWTRCRSITDAMLTYGKMPFTPSTSFIPVPYPTLTRCLLEAFDKSEFADVQFIVPGFSPIYAHKQFLQMRSPRFLAAFGSKSWHQGRAVLISVDEIPYAVVKTFMRFLYTNEFQGLDGQHEMDSEDFICLAELAEMCGETLLRKLVCDHILSDCLTTENAAFIFSSVIKRPCLEKEASLPAACLSFIVANLVDVVRSESFVALDGAIAKRILVEAASNNKSSTISKKA